MITYTLPKVYRQSAKINHSYLIKVLQLLNCSWFGLNLREDTEYFYIFFLEL